MAVWTTAPVNIRVISTLSSAFGFAAERWLCLRRPGLLDAARFEWHFT